MALLVKQLKMDLSLVLVLAIMLVEMEVKLLALRSVRLSFQFLVLVHHLVIWK
jgi:hypothetical protein